MTPEEIDERVRKEIDELLSETNPTEKSASKGMVASPRFGVSEDHLDCEIFGSEKAIAAFVRRFTTVNTSE